MGKLGAGLGDIEHPTDGGALGVACRRPRGYLSTERLHVGDTPFETLVNQYRQLDLDHVEPRGMFWGVVELQLAQDTVRFSRREGRI